MAVGLLKKEGNTNYCEFSYDNWEIDGSKIPTMTTKGKDALSTIYSCCQGSYAIGTDGTMKTLQGATNTWIDA